MRFYLSVAFVLLALSNVNNALVTNSDDFIVTFRNYAALSLQEGAITAALYTTPFNWRIRSRLPQVRTVPTDFIVLTTSHPGALTLLAGLPFIRRVHTDAQTAPRTPLSVPGQPAVPPSGSGTLHPFNSGQLWARGLTGAGVKVAVFDTGLSAKMDAIANVAERTDWTGEGAPDDEVGHGTFVAGLIGGRHTHCPGLAPGTILYAMRMFTGAQVSYTSWFLDAFNYALYVGIDVLNLSIGGPDFADAPFVDKVHELAAAGIVVVSAIGNDGPSWGSLNNPGDMLDVVGVGGAEPDGAIAPFSSRGATTHHLGAPIRSYGRVKPDIVAYARALVAPSHLDVSSCRTLSGTSVASPVVAGAIALVMSAVPRHRRRQVANPAAVKRALMRSAKFLPSSSMYEQGAGILDIAAAVDIMLEIDAEYTAFLRSRNSLRLGEARAHDTHRIPHSLAGNQESDSDVTHRNASNIAPLSIRMQQTTTASETHVQHRQLRFIRQNEPPSYLTGLVRGPKAYLFPEYLDLTTESCTLMWPHCAQPLYKGGEIHTLNISILNPAGVNGEIVDTIWIPHRNGHLLNVSVTLPQRFWPWAAGLGVHLEVVENVQLPKVIVEGVLRVVVVTPAAGAFSKVDLPIRAEVAPTPPKSKRVLWDLFHSLRYPPGYVPRDNLKEKKDLLDWLGDHPHTNYRSLFSALRTNGYFVDVLDRPLSCLGRAAARQYGALLVMDSEDYFFESERRLIRNLVVRDGMALFVAAEWYNTEIMQDICFDDDNTRSRWTPVIGGGNIHAVNQLMEPFGVTFGNAVVSGVLNVDDYQVRIESGVPIVGFPRYGELVSAARLNVLLSKTEKNVADRSGSGFGKTVKNSPMLGIAFFGRGAVVALGDTNCLDGAYKGGADGMALFLAVLKHAMQPPVPRRPLFRSSRVLQAPLVAPEDTFDARAANAFALFLPHSRVLSRVSTLHRFVSFNEVSLCDAFDSMRSMVRSELSGSNSSLSLPERAHARLVGSENRYYSTLHETLPSHVMTRFMESHIRLHAAEHVKPNAVIVIGALMGIFVGAAVMVLAMLAPFKRRAWRRQGIWSIMTRLVGSNRDE